MYFRAIKGMYCLHLVAGVFGLLARLRYSLIVLGALFCTAPTDVAAKSALLLDSSEKITRNCSGALATLVKARPNTSCLSSGRLSVIVDNGPTDRMLAALVDSVDRFSQHFGEPAEGFVLVIGRDVTPGESEVLQREDIMFFRWPALTTLTTEIEKSVRQQIATSFPGAPLPGRDELARKLIAQISKSIEVRDGVSMLEIGIIQHEIGHLLFSRWYDGPNWFETGRKGYGSSAPDWLDEAVAIASENEWMSTRRRRDMEVLQTQSVPIPPLGELFAIAHPKSDHNPALRGLPGQKGTASSTSVSVRLRVRSMDKDGRSASSYYTLIRRLVDFLADIKPNEGGSLLAKLAQASRYSPDLARTYDNLPGRPVLFPTFKSLDEKWLQTNSNYRVRT